MYLSLLGKPSDMNLERYQAVHLPGPHESDPSVLDFCYPSGDGEPPWSNNPTERFAFDPNFDEFEDYTHRAIQTLNIMDDSSQQITSFLTIMPNQHVFRTNKHVFNKDTPDYEKPSHVLVGSMLILFRKPLHSPLNGKFHFPTHFL